MENTVVFDIETLCNMFSYVDYELEMKRFNEFVIHESRDDWEEFIDYLIFLRKNKWKQVGFNNINFDAQILQWILVNRHGLADMDVNTRIERIYQQAQATIERSNNGEWPEYTEWNLSIKQIDLYKIWHFDNMAKRTSLKWCQYSMDYEDISEMPFPHDVPILEEQISALLAYNKNDVLSTHKFYEFTIGQTDHPEYQGKNKIELRNDLSEEFKKDFTNFNDVKIGDEINKIVYCRNKGIERKSLPRSGTFRSKINIADCIAPFIKFSSPELKAFLNRLKTLSFNGTKGEFKEEITYKGVKYTFGQGGIHSKDKPRIIIPEEGWILQDQDCASMYPTAIINFGLFPAHLGKEWLDGYIWVKDKRIEAKALSKKDKKYKAINEAYKLSLNGGGYGKTGERNSWQYDPWVMLYTTITNQLALLMLAECYSDFNIQVISANTDGLLLLYKEEQKEDVEWITEWWQKKSNHVLEYTNYTKFIQTSVNDYIAVKDDGEVKKKGDFMTDFEIHKNKSYKIVPIALENYFAKGIPIMETISSHTNIYDFCAGKKSVGGWYYNTLHIEDGEEIKKKQQKIIRYFISTDGEKLVKFHNDGRKSQVEAGYWKMTMFNKAFFHKDFSQYNIDYKFYEEKCMDIIEQIEGKKNHQQLSLF